MYILVDSRESAMSVLSPEYLQSYLHMSKFNE